MKKIAVIGGSKSFNLYLSKVLKIIEVQAHFYTKYMIKKESCYDYIVFNGNSSIKDIELNGSYCLINMDMIDGNSKNVNIYGNIITYGLGNKNTVTVTSMESKEEFVYCLQRDVNYNSLGKLEAGEFPINMSFESDEELYAGMVGITIGLIEGKKIKDLTKAKKLIILEK